MKHYLVAAETKAYSNPRRLIFCAHGYEFICDKAYINMLCNKTMEDSDGKRVMEEENGRNVTLPGVEVCPYVLCDVKMWLEGEWIALCIKTWNITGTLGPDSIEMCFDPG